MWAQAECVSKVVDIQLSLLRLCHFDLRSPVKPVKHLSPSFLQHVVTKVNINREVDWKLRWDA